MRFAIIYTQGSAWNVEKPLKEQRGLSDHLEYLQRLFDTKTLLIGAPFTESIGGIAIIKADGLTEAQDIAAHDPFALNHVAQVTVHPLRVLFDQQTGKSLRS
jgi:uncharacterized protein YciI